MDTYHFIETVKADGSLHLSGLPPDKEVEILVLDRANLPAEFAHWLQDIRQRHPFANISKEEILQQLRQTRETVWAEQHAG